MDRPRRLRRTAGIRDLVAETALSARQLILPLFVREGRRGSEPVPSMPGVFQHGTEPLLREAERALAAGLGGILLFGVPSRKDAEGSGAWSPRGVVQEAVRAIKKRFPGLIVATDVCLCGYTDHGHCGILEGSGEQARVANDRSIERLARTAVSHAEAGADIVAPSAMMDHQVAAIRRALREKGMDEVAILSYSAKYCSAMYGPFRDAAGSAPRFGDRAGYQMDPRNLKEAVREIELDITEGADIVMVKPALAYLDVIRTARDRFNTPVAAYNVSGEYSMVKAAAARGWLDERRVAMEILTAIRRAGADIILTYWALQAAGWIRGGA